ncbi:MAG TPA: NYN domain-containing protein, partial [Longimicrobium sp.]|nr:NYN domain-containing protein [Longimicrobium sp.]
MNNFSPRGGQNSGGGLASSGRSAALLIDFDNVTLGAHGDLGRELQALLNNDVFRGKIAVRRAYGDWRRYPNYVVPLTEANIDMIWAPSWGSSKKNTTDLRMAMDAMELCFTRPDMGTFILLTGDSDFSSCVMKLKEYGKHVIGVGMRESASDLIVKNCDEYYSYHALTGLTRASVGEGPSEDPWVLVARAARKMTDRGDSMRVDRLKQVMIDLDPGFDEKDAGFSKFSKFVQRAGERGLIRLRRDDAGQFEVIAVEDDGAAGSFASPVGPPREERDRGRERDRDRNARGRGRGRGRDREFPDRTPRILEPTGESPIERDDDRDDVDVPAAPFVPEPFVVEAPVQPAAEAPAAELSAPAGGRDRTRRGRGRGAPSGPPSLLPGQVVSVDGVTGSDAPSEAAAEAPTSRDEAPAARDEALAEAPRAGDEVLTEAPGVADEAPAEAPRARDEAPARRDEALAREAAPAGGVDPLRNAYSLLQHATRALVRGPGQAARDGDVKRRMLDMQADFDEGKLGFGKFSRFLRQAHEDEVIDLRRTGEGRYEVALPAGGGRLPAPRLTAVAPGDETPRAADTEADAPAAGRDRGRGGRGRGGQDEAPSFLPGQVPGGDDATPAAEDRAPEPSFEAQYAEARPVEPVAPAGDAGRTGMRGRGRGRGGVPSGPPPILPGQGVSMPGVAEAAPEPREEVASAPVEAEAAPAPVEVEATPPLPTDRDGAVTHMSNYKGVGRKTAEAMVDAFGENVFRAMAEDPGAVRQLLGDRRSRTLLEQFEADPLRPRDEVAPAETAPAVEARTEAAPAETASPVTVEDAPAAESAPDAPAEAAESAPDDPADAPEASGGATDGEGQEEEARTARRSRGRRGGRGRGRERGEGAAETDGAALADDVVGDTDPTLIGAAADVPVDAAPEADEAALADGGDTDPTPVGDAATDTDDAAGRARRSRRGRGRGRGRGEAADVGGAAQAGAVADPADLTFPGSDVVADAAPAAEEAPAPRGRRGRGGAAAAAAAAAEPAAPEAEA